MRRTRPARSTLAQGTRDGELARLRARVAELEGKLARRSRSAQDEAADEHQGRAAGSADIWRLCMSNLLASPDECVYFKDRFSRFILVSSNFLLDQAGGRPLEQVIGCTDADIFSHEHASAALEDERRVIATGEPIVRKVERETFPDRPDQFAETTKMPLRNDNGEIVGTFGISRDITDAYKAMKRQAAMAKVGEALARATSVDQIYRALLSGVVDVLPAHAIRAAIVSLGRSTPRVVASTAEGIEHRRVLDAVKAALASSSRLDRQPALITRDQLVIVPMGTPGAARFGRSAKVGPFAGQHENSTPWLGAVVLEVDRDLSEASQEAINWLVSTVSLILDGLLAARRLRSLVSRSSDALVVLALDGSVGYVAPSVTRTLGYSTFLTLGHPLNEFVHPDDIARLAAALTPPVRDTQLEVRWRHADGSWRDTETTVADLSADPEVEGIALAVRDITERKVLEWELRNSYKLQAVGQLAGGVAHEINTPVQFITDNLQFLQEAFTALLGALGSYRQVLGRGRPPGGSVADELAAIDEAAELGYLNGEVPSALSQALDGAQRVANIVRALKAFGHPDTGEPVPTDVNEVMRNTLTMARNEMKYVADVTEDLGDLPAAMVVPGDIGQVFLNLVVNAAHAIAEKVEGTRDRGHIAVSTRCEGDTAVIRISDDGMGIRDEIRERIFEPFFTTKDVGKGTGQGLALARATVEAHGGSLDFESVPGVGTTFITRLPLRGGTAPEGADASTSSPGKARAHR